MKLKTQALLHLYYSDKPYYTGEIPDGVEVLWNGHRYPVFHCFNGLLVKLVSECKLILRPLSDITNEEIEYVGLTLKQGTWNAPDIRINPKLAWSIHHMNPIVFAYLLKQGFDLFDLIDSGEAIDKTKFDKETE